MVQNVVLKDGFGGRGREAVAHGYVETLKLLRESRSAVRGGGLQDVDEGGGEDGDEVGREDERETAIASAWGRAIEEMKEMRASLVDSREYCSVTLVKQPTYQLQGLWWEILGQHIRSWLSHSRGRRKEAAEVDEELVRV